MFSNTYSRAALVAAGLLAPTVSAAFSAQSSTNVAVYWGQGYAQIDLSEVCNDDSVDIVNLAFVNQFPKKIGEYPATNFANACGDQKFLYPDGTESGLLSNCPGIEPGIKKCQANGKKVLLSIGGGWPTDYYLESKEIAEYFAEFLWGAFGPKTDAWVADGKPRPFGDASVDGFDLDIESWMDPAPFAEYMYANYGHFVSHLKNTLFPTGPSGSQYYISAAPQCVVPDIRLADAIATSSFDFIFIQFYNTPQCSSRAGLNGIGKPSTTFTLDAWVQWLSRNSANDGVKVYIGLPANEAGAPSDIASYLKPTEAEKLISHYAAKHSSMFGGVMLWEASLSARNEICSKSYGSYIKDILVGDFTAPPSSCPSTTSSSSSTATATSTQTPQPTGGKTPDGSCGGANGYTCVGFVDGECCSAYGYCGSSSDHCGTGCQEPFGNCGLPSSSSSASATSTSASSSSSSSSSIVSSSSSASATSTSASSSSASATSTDIPSSSTAVSSTESVSSSSSVESSSSSSVPYPTGANSTLSSTSPTGASSTIYPTGGSSSVYPTEISVVPYPTGSNHTSGGVYPSGTGYYSASTSCTTSTAHGSDYPAESASTLASDYPAESSSTPASDYPSESSSTPASYSASSSGAYPTSSSPAASSTASVPGYPEPSSAPYPTSAPPVYPSSVVASPSKGSDVTTTVITTSYVDICPTGLTTVVTEITKTVCPKCDAVPTTTGVPEGWYTTVTVCTKCGPATTTVTLTKPYDTPQPTGETYVPGKPEGETPEEETYVPETPEEETYVPEKPEGETYVPEKPEEETYVPETPEGETYVPGYPSEDTTKHATSTIVQVITLTKVPIPASSVPTAPYVSANNTNVYAPTGTASSTGYGSYPTYAPPQFEGAASRFGVGISTVGIVLVAVLAM